MRYVIRFLRHFFGNPRPRPENGHDRAARRERNWYPRSTADPKGVISHERTATLNVTNRSPRLRKNTFP
jgi:hypothetical protein